MQGMYQTLRGLCVAKERTAPLVGVLQPAVGAITVAFGKSGIVVVWDFGAPSLLSFAKDQGLTP
jgi:hypothetical protein